MSLGLRLVVLALLGGSAAAQPSLALGAQPAVALEASTELSDTGHYRISWSAGENAEVTVQESSTADFSDARTIYQGTDRATVISGRLDGTFYYRARADGGAWTAPLAVEVRHHSLTTAFAYLAVGAVVFLATAVLIVAGHLRHRREHGRPQETP